MTTPTPNLPITPVTETIHETTSLASVTELVNQADRLGLKWNLRPATVVRTTVNATPYVVDVVMDGDDDDTVISSPSFVGGLAVDMRVMVMSVPPVGNYVVAIISTDDIAHYQIGTLANHPTTLTTVETVLDTFKGFRVLKDAAYRVEIGNTLIAAPTTFSSFRVRKTNVAGVSWGTSGLFPGVGLALAPFHVVTYFKNLTGATITADIVVTGVTTVTTAVWSGAADVPRYVSIEYAGPAVEYPGAVLAT